MNSESKLQALYEQSKDLGWTRRANGEYTRFLQFPRPITPGEVAVLVPALVFYSGPRGVAVKPTDELTYELTSDATMMRIRVKRRPVPAAATLRVTPSRTVTLTSGLFGSQADATVLS